MKLRVVERKRKYMLMSIVEPFIKKLKTIYTSLDLDYKIIKDKYFGDERDQVHIRLIKSTKFGQGPLALQRLCDWADKHEVFLSVCAVDFFGVDENILIKGYQKMGFKSYGSSPNNMVREPK